MSFAAFKAHILKSAEKIGTRLRNEHRIQSRHNSSSTNTIMSSNSTTQAVNSTTVTVDKVQYDQMKEALDRSQRLGSQSSYYNNNRNRSRSRSTEPRTYQGSRARSPSSESRGRSPKRGRTVAFRTDERPTSPYNATTRSTSPHRNVQRK